MSNFSNTQLQRDSVSVVFEEVNKDSVIEIGKEPFADSQRPFYITFLGNSYFYEDEIERNSDARMLGKLKDGRAVSV